MSGLLLRTPERGQFNPLGHCDGGKVPRLAAFGDRLDDPRRQKRQPHHAAHVTPRKMFSPGDLANRPRPTRQQIVGPSIRTGGRVEEACRHGRAAALAFHFKRGPTLLAEPRCGGVVELARRARHWITQQSPRRTYRPRPGGSDRGRRATRSRDRSCQPRLQLRARLPRCCAVESAAGEHLRSGGENRITASFALALVPFLNAHEALAEAITKPCQAVPTFPNTRSSDDRSRASAIENQCMPRWPFKS